MKRKLVACILMVALFAAIGLTAAASGGKMEVQAAYSKTAAVGDTITLEITAKDNPGLCAVQLTLEYDKTALECTSVSAGALMSKMMTASNPNSAKGAIIAGAGTTPYNGDGLIASFNFKVLKSDYDSLSLTDALFTSEGEQDIPFTVSGLTYKEVLPPSPSPTPPPPTQGGAYTSKYFTDTAGHWAAEYIDEACEAKLVEGYGGGLYGPDDEMTRAQFVTVLWRGEGEPEPKGKSSFTDLDSDIVWAHKAIAWAEENGLTNGVGNNRFDPYGKLTREQMATILFRISGGISGGELMLTGVYDNAFSDSGGISSWAKAAVYWAVYNEIWCGTDSADVGTRLYSNNNASRAEMAVMMVRFGEIRGG